MKQEKDLLKNLPPLAKWKLLILHYNLDCPRNLLGHIRNIRNYKVKYRLKKPTVENKRVFDVSKDNNIIPSELILSSKEGNKTLVKINYKKGSPLILKKTKKNELYIFDKRSKTVAPLNINLIKNKRYNSLVIPQGRLAYQGSLLKNYIEIIGIDRIGILAYEGCIHWNNKCACKFCDSTPRRKEEKAIRPSLNSLYDFGNVDAWWDFYKDNYLDGIKYSFQKIVRTEFKNFGPHKHFQLMAGNLPDPDKVWEISLEISKLINKVYPLSKMDSYLNIAAPRKDTTKHLKMAKKLGFQNIAFNLEVIGKEDFKEVCPGKSMNFGYNRTLRCMRKAVKIFGKGKVRTNFVLGAQETNKLINGIKKLAEGGIVADYSVFIPKLGTPWEKKIRPNIKEILKVTTELCKIYKKYNFKAIYCELSSRSNITHEVLNQI